MIRKLILSAVIAMTALTNLTAPRADAAVPTLLPHHRFEVLAERGGAWESHGIFRIRAEAEIRAIRLRHQGYKVEIRQF
jgi:hypothetical protein